MTLTYHVFLKIYFLLFNFSNLSPKWGVQDTIKAKVSGDMLPSQYKILQMHGQNLILLRQINVEDIKTYI